MTRPTLKKSAAKGKAAAAESQTASTTVVLAAHGKRSHEQVAGAADSGSGAVAARKEAKGLDFDLDTASTVLATGIQVPPPLPSSTQTDKAWKWLHLLDDVVHRRSSEHDGKLGVQQLKRSMGHITAVLGKWDEEVEAGNGNGNGVNVLQAQAAIGLRLMVLGLAEWGVNRTTHRRAVLKSSGMATTAALERVEPAARDIIRFLSSTNVTTNNVGREVVDEVYAWVHSKLYPRLPNGKIGRKPEMPHVELCLHLFELGQVGAQFAAAGVPLHPWALPLAQIKNAVRQKQQQPAANSPESSPASSSPELSSPESSSPASSSTSTPETLLSDSKPESSSASSSSSPANAATDSADNLSRDKRMAAYAPDLETVLAAQGGAGAQVSMGAFLETLDQMGVSSIGGRVMHAMVALMAVYDSQDQTARAASEAAASGSGATVVPTVPAARQVLVVADADGFFPTQALLEVFYQCKWISLHIHGALSSMNHWYLSSRQVHVGTYHVVPSEVPEAADARAFAQILRNRLHLEHCPVLLLAADASFTIMHNMLSPVTGTHGGAIRCAWAFCTSDSDVAVVILAWARMWVRVRNSVITAAPVTFSGPPSFASIAVGSPFSAASLNTNAPAFPQSRLSRLLATTAQVASADLTLG